MHSCPFLSLIISTNLEFRSKIVITRWPRFFSGCPQDLRVSRGYPCALAHVGKGSGVPSHPRVPGQPGDTAHLHPVRLFLSPWPIRPGATFRRCFLLGCTLGRHNNHTVDDTPDNDPIHRERANL